MGLRCECEYADFAANSRFREIVEAIGFPNLTYATPS
jgi:hypothetical protein